jgi:mannose-6-phosphate isomerase-like protein (cupin superfamily)
MATMVRRGFGIRTGSAMPVLLKARLRPWNFPRTVTNAAGPEYIQSLQSVRKGPEKDGGWHPTLVHSSGDLKWTVIRLQPGHGEVPSHFHTKVWDYFIPLSGKAVIETKTKDGIEKSYEMLPDTFLGVPAGDLHRVRNASQDEEFVFLIAQSPRSMYDFVDSKESMAGTD